MEKNQCMARHIIQDEHGIVDFSFARVIRSWLFFFFFSHVVARGSNYLANRFISLMKREIV